TLEPRWNANSLDLVATAGPPPQILFASDSGGGLSVGIYTTDGTGPNATRVIGLTDLGYERQFPRWSPDRKRIAYSSGSFGSPNALFVMTASGDTNTVVVNDTSTFYPRWSPDGRHLGFLCGDGFSQIDVCVIGDVTGPIGSIPLNNYVVVSDYVPTAWLDGPVAAAWDPLDLDRAVFARDSSDGVNPPTSRFFTGSYTGTDVQPLHTSILDVGNGPLQVRGTMDWSADGSMLAFAARDPLGTEKIYVMNADGTGLRQLTFLSGLDDGPLFSPDGSEILFGRDESCSYNGWIVDINNTDGSLERQITDDNICDFDLDLLAGDWSPDGSEIVLTGFDPTTGWTQIYVVPRTVTAATYRTLRVLVGRDADAGSWLREIQPSWRP
ncbi:MAG: PD40 domain-containing protein, partial [Gemmatimonadota bacterium]